MQVAVELVQQPIVQPHRDWVQCAAGHVHLVAGQQARVVRRRKSVTQLDAEGQPARRGDRFQRRDQCNGAVVLQVVFERRVRDLHLVETELFVEDGEDGVFAEQRRVQLHDRVQAPLLEAVARNPLDFVRRAAVHRRERDAVDDAGRDAKVGELRELAADDRTDLPQGLGGVGEHVHEPRHPGCTDAGEVVTDAHVEDGAGARGGRRGVALPAEHARQQVDECPGHHVLVRGLLEAEFLRPFDVVALVRHVDARAGDCEVVTHLDRLELDEPPAAQPGGHDVLAELSVGPRRGAKRGVQPLAEKGGKTEREPRCVEERDRNPEDLPLPLVLHQHAAELRGERLHAHHVGHRRQCNRDAVAGVSRWRRRPACVSC